jgi:hypothetical protein
LTTAASTAALAVGVTEMMYLALAPRSSAVVGTIVELSEKIVKTMTIITLIRWLRFLRMNFSFY